MNQFTGAQGEDEITKSATRIMKKRDFIGIIQEGSGSLFIKPPNGFPSAFRY
jgi:hypothetical protein